MSTLDPVSVERTWMSRPELVFLFKDAQYLAPGEARGTGYERWLNRDDDRPADWVESTRFLTDHERRPFDADYDDLSKGGYEAFVDDLQLGSTLFFKHQWGIGNAEDDPVGNDLANVVGGAAAMPFQFGGDVVTEGASLLRLAVAADIALDTGNTKPLQSALPSEDGSSAQELFPLTVGTVQAANRSLDRVLSGDFSAYSDKPFSTALEDLGTAALLFTPASSALSARAAAGPRSIHELEAGAGLDAGHARGELVALEDGGTVFAASQFDNAAAALLGHPMKVEQYRTALAARGLTSVAAAGRKPAGPADPRAPPLGAARPNSDWSRRSTTHPAPASPPTTRSSTRIQVPRPASPKSSTSSPPWSRGGPRTICTRRRPTRQPTVAHSGFVRLTTSPAPGTVCSLLPRRRARRARTSGCRR